jgi:hypothetical protein
MADDKKNADTTGTKAASTKADEPNPKATDGGTGTATPEEAVLAETGAPQFPPSVDEENTVFETPEVEDLEVDVNDEPVAAQKMGQPPTRPEEYPVYEVSVQTDKHVDYVIVPPEGRGDATLPIHHYANAKRPEEVFAAEASENEDES